MSRQVLALASIFLLTMANLQAWGLRGHTVANLAAVAAIPDDGPVVLRAEKAYIGHLGAIPDTWRSPTEPYLRISEDPNHGWYTEDFDFIKEIPRSRTEFTLRVYDEYLRVSKTNPERAKLLNIRYTGLQAYSMMEGYERMKAGMRLYRRAGGLYAAISPLYKNSEDVREYFARDVAFYMGWLGHYIADAAMPLHNSKHHDGWVGANPHGYTRETEIHGRFESAYVDLIGATEEDARPYVRKDARYLDDPWTAILDHMLEARNSVEEVYRLDLRKAYSNKDDSEARKLVYTRLASGASFLRDLAYTAWNESAKPLPALKPGELPNSLENPLYNPATGSAPAPRK